MFIVKGTWGDGTVATAGRGYPCNDQQGCSLADGLMAANQDDTYWGRQLHQGHSMGSPHGRPGRVRRASHLPHRDRPEGVADSRRRANRLAA